MSRLRQTLRKLVQSPGFTGLAIFTLAIGIAANAAIFAVVDAILIRPLPFPDAERLVFVGHKAPGLGFDQLNQSDALHFYYLENAKSFEGLGMIDDHAATLTGFDRPRRLSAARVTPGAFALLRTPPLVGRYFNEQEGHPGGPRSAVISESLWSRQFAADADAVGRVIEVDGVGREIVGIAPDLDFPERGVELWIPMDLDPNEADIGSFGRSAVARLRDGVSMEQAQAELDSLATPLANAFPDDEAAKILDNAGFRPYIEGLREEIVGDLRGALWILLGTVGFVLLIACANVANLFLVRTEARRRETAIRSALGASRFDLAVAGFAESITLGLAAGIAGLALAVAAVEALQRFGPQELPRLHEVAVDGRTALFTVLLSIASGLLFGLVPAFRSTFRELSSVLKEGGRATTTGRERHLVRGALVAGQVALALMLLIGAGLMVRSFDRLAHVDPGFRADGRTLTFGLSLPAAKYGDDTSAAAFFTALIEQLESIPGVEQAAATSAIPLGGKNNGGGHSIEGQEPEEGELPPVFFFQQISAGYLETSGIRLLAGRDFTATESTDRSGSCLINQSAAKKYWPGESPLGKRLSSSDDEDGERDPWYTVIGVVGDVRTNRLKDKPSDTVYYPLLAKKAGDLMPRQMDVVVRFQGDRGAITDAARQRVWALDADLPIPQVRTLEDLVIAARSRMAFTVVMLLIAAAVALLLGAVGTYGVISYLVTERRNEIGVRMALGAQAGQVAGMVVRQGVFLAAIGSLAGLAGAAALTRSLRALLFEIDPMDPVTFALVPLLLMLVASLASAIPALRAANLDPMKVLREE